MCVGPKCFSNMDQVGNFTKLTLSISLSKSAEIFECLNKSHVRSCVQFFCGVSAMLIVFQLVAVALLIGLSLLLLIEVEFA